MKARIIIGAVLILLISALLWLDWWLERAGLPQLPARVVAQSQPLKALPLAALLTLLIAAGYLELARLAESAGAGTLGFTGLLATLIVGTLPFWRQMTDPDEPMLLAAVLGLTMLAFFIDQIVHYRTAGVVRRVGASLLAVGYLGVCGALLLAIRIRFGVPMLVLFLVAVKGTDIGAYFAGSWLGRHRLIPWLSPKKTWEGLIGGLILAAAGGVGVAAASRSLPGGGAGMALPAAAALAVVLGFVGQIADMCESAMKRDAGLKDSGAALPAFGGVLDVLDSPLLAAPVAYLLLAAVA